MVCVLATVIYFFNFVATSVVCLLFDYPSTVNNTILCTIAQTWFSRCYVSCSPVPITPVYWDIFLPFVCAYVRACVCVCVHQYVHASVCTCVYSYMRIRPGHLLDNCDH